MPPKVVAPATLSVLEKPSAMVKSEPALRVKAPPMVLLEALAVWPTARVAPLATVAAVTPVRLPPGPRTSLPVLTVVRPV